ncbi:MAG: GLUG motif-containing protein, partial [Planctomycetota bacterium]
MSETRNSSLLGKITVIIVICFFVLPAQAKYGGGTGEPNDPYLIAYAHHMQAIGADPCDWGKHFKLIADIDLSSYTGKSFNIIGYYVNWYHPDNKPFNGVFDGNGHTISNFTWHSTDINKAGLFALVNGGEIKNLGMINPNVINENAPWYVGALVGCLGVPDGGTITNCYVEGGSISGDWCAGGLVGYNWEGTISDCYAVSTVTGAVDDEDGGVGGLCGVNDEGTIINCYSVGSVTGEDTVGGLCGLIDGGTIINCYSVGSVTGEATVGGLVGDNYYSGSITNCYSTASVTGSYRVGGLAGRSGIFARIDNCYSTGSVDGTTSVGGLVGINYSYGTITNCYSTSDVYGVSGVGALVGYDNSGSYTKSFWDNTVNSGLPGIGNTSDPNVRGESTANMQTQSTFTDAGWDFVNIWWISEGLDYPRLWWEAKYGGGSGTEEDPYQIWDANHMQAIGADANDWDRHFKLVADIDLSAYTGTEFNIIGHYEGYGHPSNKPFTGVFDGNGHSISNFTYNSAAINYIGLFAYVDGPNAEIKDLTLIEPTVNANDRVGSLVGYLLVKGTISNCGVEGGSVWGDFLVGGLVGFNYDGCISNCYSTANVNGNDLTGGLAGANVYPGDPKRGSMSNCYAAGNVVGNVNTGGLVGGAGFCAIVNSYSVSAVNGNEHTGGLVGNIWGDSPMFLSNCYAAG